MLWLFRWDTSLCGGPIVEQATHFVDLMRFFGGELVEDTVKAVAVGPEQSLSDMPKAPEAEHEVSLPQRGFKHTQQHFAIFGTVGRQSVGSSCCGARPIFVAYA